MGEVIRTVRSNMTLLRQYLLGEPRVELCKNIIYAIDIPRIGIFEAAERLWRTGDYDAACSMILNDMEVGKQAIDKYKPMLEPIGEEFDRFYEKEIVPLFTSLISLYQERAAPEVIMEQTFSVDRKLYDFTFDWFLKCVEKGETVGVGAPLYYKTYDDFR